MPLAGKRKLFKVARSFKFSIKLHWTRTLLSAVSICNFLLQKSKTTTEFGIKWGGKFQNLRTLKLCLSHNFTQSQSFTACLQRISIKRLIIRTQVRFLTKSSLTDWLLENFSDGNTHHFKCFKISVDPSQRCLDIDCSNRALAAPFLRKLTKVYANFNFTDLASNEDFAFIFNQISSENFKSKLIIQNSLDYAGLSSRLTGILGAIFEISNNRSSVGNQNLVIIRINVRHIVTDGFDSDGELRFYYEDMPITPDINHVFWENLKIVSEGGKKIKVKEEVIFKYPAYERKKFVIGYGDSLIIDFRYFVCCQNHKSKDPIIECRISSSTWYGNLATGLSHIRRWFKV